MTEDFRGLRDLLVVGREAESADHSGELKGWRGRPLWTKVSNVSQSDVDHGRVPSALIVAAVNSLPGLLERIDKLEMLLREVQCRRELP